MSNTIEEITSILNAERIGNAPAKIDWILTDSRSLCFPEETLFFALKTKRNDGHKYIAELSNRGPCRKSQRTLRCACDWNYRK